MTELRGSLQRSLAFAVQRAQAESHGYQSALTLSTISRPVGGGRNAILLVVSRPGGSGSYNVRTCARDDTDAIRAHVLDEATAFVHSVGGVAL